MARMATIGVDEPDAAACSFLGLVDDPRSHFTYPHPAHRCFAAKRAQTTDLHRQQEFCLTTEFVACDRYLAWRNAMETDRRPRFRRPWGTRSPADVNATSPTEGAPPTVIYVFRMGDSLARIATTYGLSIEQIVATNQLDPNVPVTDGARLVIPIDRPPGDIPGAQRAGPKAGT
jgi:LysM repeat protein